MFMNRFVDIDLVFTSHCSERSEIEESKRLRHILKHKENTNMEAQQQKSIHPYTLTYSDRHIHAHLFTEMHVIVLFVSVI